MADLDDLHRVLAGRADEVSDAVPDVDAAISRAGRQRSARRAAVGLGAVSVAAAIALPFALGLGSPVERQDPQATLTSTTDGVDPDGGWVQNVPGIDLPLGDPLTMPYAVDEVLHANAARYNFPGPITQVIEAPEGLVVVAYDGPLPPPGSGTRLTSTLTLLVDDGDTVDYQEIAAGYLGSVEAGRTASGATRLGWVRYQGDGGVETSELGTVVLGAGQPPSVLTTPAVELVDVADGEVLVEDVTVSPQQVSRWDLASGTLLPVFAPDFGDDLLAIGIGDDRDLGVFTRSSGDTQCVVAAPLADSSAPSWEYCGAPYLYLSPDHLVGTDGLDLVDLQTGEVTGELGHGVPRRDWQREAPLPYTEAGVRGWIDGDVLLEVSYTTAGAVHTAGTAENSTLTYTTPVYVVVRCSTENGACERIPHDVNVIATAPTD